MNDRLDHQASELDREMRLFGHLRDDAPDETLIERVRAAVVEEARRIAASRRKPAWAMRCLGAAAAVGLALGIAGLQQMRPTAAASAGFAEEVLRDWMRAYEESSDRLTMQLMGVEFADSETELEGLLDMMSSDWGAS